MNDSVGTLETIDFRGINEAAVASRSWFDSVSDDKSFSILESEQLGGGRQAGNRSRAAARWSSPTFSLPAVQRRYEKVTVEVGQYHTKVEFVRKQASTASV